MPEHSLQRTVLGHQAWARELVWAGFLQCPLYSLSYKLLKHHLQICHRFLDSQDLFQWTHSVQGNLVPRAFPFWIGSTQFKREKPWERGWVQGTLGCLNNVHFSARAPFAGTKSERGPSVQGYPSVPSSAIQCSRFYASGFYTVPGISHSFQLNSIDYLASHRGCLYVFDFLSVDLQVARKAEALQVQRQSHIRFDEGEEETWCWVNKVGRSYAHLLSSERNTRPRFTYLIDGAAESRNWVKTWSRRGQICVRAAIDQSLCLFHEPVIPNKQKNMGAFTRQENVGQLVLSNLNWCVWTVQHVGKLLATNRTRLYSRHLFPNLLLCRSRRHARARTHTNSWPTFVCRVSAALGSFPSIMMVSIDRFFYSYSCPYTG